MKDKELLNEKELEKILGGEDRSDAGSEAGGGNPVGNFGIRYSDDCHYTPSHFENAFDPKTWSRTAECARCVYNSNRFWEYSTCLFAEKHKNQ